MVDALSQDVLRTEELYSDKARVYFERPRTDIKPLVPGGAIRLLELGCGTGATVGMIRNDQEVRYAVGFELDPDAALKARSVFDEVIVGNAETTELPDQEFDVILALDVLEHLVDPWRMVSRLKRVLAPGGVLIASIPNVAHYSVCLKLLRGRWDYTSEGLLDRTHLRFFTEKTAIELMTLPGLRVQSILRNYQEPILARFKNAQLRWYQRRTMQLLMPERMLVVQYLIASVASS